MKNRTDFFNTNITYFILITLFVLVRIGTATNAFAFLGDSAEYVLNCLVQIGFMFSVPVFVFKMLSKKTYKQTFSDFRFKKIDFKSVLIAILIGIVVFVLNIAISSFFNFVIQMFGYSPIYGSGAEESYSVWKFLVSLIMTAVLPGICEEVAHRGLLLNGFKDLGMKKAILLSGLLFGLMHLNIEQFFYASIIGFLLALITICTGSIFPAMIIHFMNNGISVYLEFARANKLPLGNFYGWITSLISSSNIVVVLLFIFLVLVGLLFALAWLVYLLFNQTKGKKINAIIKDLNKSLGDESEKSIIKIPVSQLGINIKQKRKPDYIEKIFLYSTLILSIGVTISTFIWGVL